MKNNSSRFLVVLISILVLFAWQTFAAITYVSQFGGSGSGNGQFNSPFGVTIDSSGNIYVADRFNQRIQKFNSSGVYVSQFGSYGSGDGQFDSPLSTAIDSSGNIYVVDKNNVRIQKFNSSGVYVSQFGNYGTGDGQFGTFDSSSGIAVDSSDNIYVVDTGNRRIQKFNSSGVYVSQFGSYGSGDGQFNAPRGITIDSSGDIYVVDANNSRIQKFNSSGVYVSQFGTAGSGDGGLSSPYSIAVNSSGDIYVGDSGNVRIQKFNSSGVYVSQFGTAGSGNGQFSTLRGIALNNSGNIYAVDLSNHRIQILSDISDTTAPVISQTTSVTTPTNDTTPNYTFTTDEAGTITYGGSCSSATTSATVGANTITFNTLADGTYSNCTITVTDAASNVSSALAVTAFTVDATAVAPVVTRPSNNEIIQTATSTSEGTCETWATVSISNANLQTNPTTVVCSGGTFSTPITFQSGSGTEITLSYTQTDAANNTSSAETRVIRYALPSGNGGGGGAVINEEKKAEKAEEKEQKEQAKEEKKAEKEQAKAEKEQAKEEKKDKKTTKAEILSEIPLYEPFATRERTLSIALKLSGIEVTGMYICQNKFTDTPTPYSCEVAEKSQAAGLISQERTTFRPTRSVTRVEAYAIFMKSICVAPETNENNWQKSIIKKAIELGFTTRTVDTFRPDRTISTPEMFALARKIGEWKTNNPDSCENK